MKTIQKIVNAGFKVEIDSETIQVINDFGVLLNVPFTSVDEYLRVLLLCNSYAIIDKDLYSDEEEKKALLDLIDTLEERKETKHKQELKAFYNGTGK